MVSVKRNMVGYNKFLVIAAVVFISCH